jgi:hypothetical protein
MEELSASSHEAGGVGLPVTKMTSESKLAALEIAVETIKLKV